MTKNSVIAELKKYSKGAAVITQAQISEFLGCDRHTTARILAEAKLRGINGKRYYISEVAIVLQQSMK